MTNDEAWNLFKSSNNSIVDRKNAETEITSRKKEASAASNMAIMATGAAIMSANRPPQNYQAPMYLQPYPSDTVIIQQNTRPYRFIDSSPYK